MKHRKRGRRHGEKRSHRNILPIPQRHHPRQVRIMYNHIRLRLLEPIQQLLHRRFQRRLGGSEEGGEVVCAADFRRYDVGDGGESDVFRLGVAGDEAIPFLSEYEGEECVGAMDGDELAEVHHGVDVAAAGIRHRHHMAFIHLGNRHHLELSTAVEQEDKNLSSMKRICCEEWFILKVKIQLLIFIYTIYFT